MSKINQTIVLIAVLLATITITAIYIHEIDPETIQSRLVFNIKQELGTPETATFLGTKQYELVNTTITVYTWKQNNTLYEAQLSEENMILETSVYQYNDTMISMTPALAETLAEQLLITETEYPPGSRYLSEPTFRLFEFDDRGPRWIVKWGLHSGNYTISNVGFMVYVFTETGKTIIADNDFDEITDIPDFEPPTISKEEATQLAMKYYSESMDYTVIDSTRPRGLEISSGDIFIDEPFRLFWTVTVSGMGQVKGAPTKKSPTIMVDAYTGEVLASYYISWGWDTVNWEKIDHAYYGSVYPHIIDNTPHDYKLPLSNDEIRSMLSDAFSLRGLYENETFHIKIYNEIKLADDLTWDAIITELVDGEPVIAAYWSKAYDWVKTGTVIPIDNIQGFLDSEDILEGFFIILNPETGEILNQYNSTSIGPPSNSLNITREQAINITLSSPLADPEDKIIEPDALVSAEPRIIKPDWVNQLSYSGGIRRLYIADVNQTDSRIYWVVRYEKTPEVHGGFTGTYLVDAETRALALALEDYPLVQMLMRGSAPDQVLVNGSGVVNFNVSVVAVSTLEAQLPVSITAELVPENVTFIIKDPVKQFSGEKMAVFNITAIIGDKAESGTHNIRFSISFPGRRTSTYTTLQIIREPEPVFRVESHKPEYRIMEVICFNIEAPEPQNGSYITIKDPNGTTVWITDPFTEWYDVPPTWRVPYYRQLSDGNPMSLTEEHPLGDWTWTYRYQNTTVEGWFTVREAADDVIGIGVTDLSDEDLAENIPDLGGPITNVSVIAEEGMGSQAGPVLARDSTCSNNMWIPVIISIIVILVILNKNRRK